jgi:hypothetical protein
MKITMWYNCDTCGASKEPFQVRGRREREDIKHYMERTVGNAIVQAHRLKHPDCPSRKVDLIIPAPKDIEFIGDPKADYSGHTIPPDFKEKASG